MKAEGDLLVPAMTAAQEVEDGLPGRMGEAGRQAGAVGC